MLSPVTNDTTIPRRRVADHVDATVSAEKQDASANRYRELGEINRGGCGLIVKAFDQHLHRFVAIKKILPEHLGQSDIKSRFLHEARITAYLEHPGIVPVHDVGHDPIDGTPFYAMQYLQGKTLAEALAERSNENGTRARNLATRELLIRFQQVCNAIAYAHKQGIVQRDLKPANIMLGAFGETVVLDWGIAKILPDSPIYQDASLGSETNDVQALTEAPDSNLVGRNSERLSDLTVEGTVIGSAAYMSPEQARGDCNDVDRRSDVFSLGTILYEILTEKSPFRCPTTHETIQHVVRVEYEPVRRIAPHIPRSLAAICDKAMAAEPQNRYSHAGELERDIDAYFGSDSVLAYSEPWWMKVDRLATKYRALTWFVFGTLWVVTTISLASSALIGTARQAERTTRLLADREHTEKMDALERERIAHSEAVTQLQSARESVDGWILELGADLALYPGLEELRLHLIDRAQTHYQTLASQQSNSPLENLELARANIRLGELKRILRQKDQAIQCFEVGSSRLEHSLSDVDSDWRPIEQIQLAQAKLGHANVLLDRHEDLALSRQLIDDAIRLAKAIDKSSHEFSESLYTLANGLQLSAAHRFAEGDCDGAESDLEKAIALEQLRDSNPIHTASHRSHRSQLNKLTDLAKYRYEAGKYAPAKDAYQQIIQLYDKLLADGRRRPDWLEARAGAQVYLAVCNSHLIQPNESILAFEAAEVDLQNAWQIFAGDSLFQDKVSSIYKGMGQSLLLVGDFEEAEHIFRMSIDALKRLTAASNRDPSLPRRLLQNQLWLCMAIENQHRDDMAPYLDEAAIAIKNIQANQPMDSELDDLICQFAWVQAKYHMLKGEYDSAHKLLDEAIARPSAVHLQNTVLGYGDLYRGRLMMLLGQIHSIQGDSLSAGKLKSAAQDKLRSALTSQLKPAAAASFDLLQSWCETKNLTDTERQECIQLAAAMTEQHETSPTAWYWRAEVEYRFGESKEAESSLIKLRRLRRRLTAQDVLLAELMHRKHPEINVRLPANPSLEPTTKLLSRPVAKLDMNPFPLGSHARFLQQELQSIVAIQ